MTKFLDRIISILDKFINLIGGIAAIAMILMLLNVFYDVIMRYFFQNSSIGMQELEWHLFAVVFLFGMAYSLKEDAHVRVDMFYEKMAPKKQAIINLLGALIFIIPFALIIINSGYDFASGSYEMGEISGDPGGLTNRWIIKSAIATSFVFLLIATLSFILKNGSIIFESREIKQHKHSDEVL